MAILYAPSRYVPVDGSGHVYPGAKLYFYQTGTVTLQDTYSDADLAVGHKNTNPVVADSNGLFGPIYLGNNTVEYKAILKTSADVTVWTTDPLSSTVAQSGLTPYAADTGTATAYAIAPTPAVTSVSVGQGYRFLAGNTNTTTTPTLTVGSTSAGVITWPNGTALSAGDIKANAMVEVIVATATPTYHLQTYMGRWRIFGVVDMAAAALADFTGIPASVSHLMSLWEVKVSTDASSLSIRTYGADGVLDTGGSDYAQSFIAWSGAGTSSVNPGTGSAMSLTGANIDNNATIACGGDLIASNIQAATYTKFNWRCGYLDNGGTNVIALAGFGYRQEADRITGIRLLVSAGTMTGKMTLYVAE